MKKEQFATIGYGNLNFSFFISESVSDFMKENKISSEMCFPKTQFFYQGVLMKLGISHEDYYSLEILYNGMRLEESGVLDILSEGYEKFENFPIHIDDKIYLVDFGVKILEKFDNQIVGGQN